MDARRVVGSSVATALMAVLAHTRAVLRRFTLQTKEGLTMDARRVVGSIVAAALMTVLLPGSALAEDPEETVYELEEFVVTATMTERDIEQVPASMEVITRTEIEEMGAETVAEALKEAQSLTLQGVSGRGTVASLRGLSTKHTLVLVDGKRLSTGFRNNMDLGEIPTSMIERIEIVRGPSSALYGSDAVGGVINIITKPPSEKWTGGVTLGYGQSRYGEAENPLSKGHFAGRTGKIGYSLSGHFNQKDRYDRDKSTVQTDGDDKRIVSGTGKLSFDLAQDHRLWAGLEFAQTQREGIRTFGWGSGTREADSQRRAYFLEYQGKFRERSDVMLRGYQSHFETDIKVTPLEAGPGGTLLTQTGEPYHLNQDLTQMEGRWSERFFDQHRMTLGAEYRIEKRKDNDSDDDVNNSAFFFQDEFQVSDPFLLVLGVRYDRHSDFGSAFSPRVSTMYAVNEALRLKGSYGEGFRAPTIFELYIESDTKRSLIHPNPDLDAETSRSYELGAEGKYGIFSGGITAFRNDLNDMIHTVQVGTDTLKGKGKGGGKGGGKPKTRPILEYRNVAEAMTQGLEINASLRLPLGFVLSDNATLMNTEDKGTGEELFNRPDFMNSAKLTYKNARFGIRTNVRATTVGSQKTSATEEAEGYTFWHLRASKRLFGFFEVHAGVNNVFNKKPSVYGCVGSAGDTGTFFYGGVSAEFR